MNDLRTTVGIVNGANGLGGRDGGISSAPPRVRPEPDVDRATARRMSYRQSIAERARQEGTDDFDESDPETVAVAGDPSAGRAGDSGEGGDSGDATLLDDRARRRLVDAKLAERASRHSQSDKGPNSRPSRRRTIEEPAAKGDDGFPWTFHLDDDEDEPEELQASTPLLSRAFRASTA